MPAIAFFTEEEGVFTPGLFARSLWAPNSLNGPAVCALAAYVAENEFSREGMRPARFTIDMFKMAREEPTTAHGRVTREGGRIRVVEIDLRQPDKSGEEAVVARSTVVFLRESVDPPGERWTPPSDFTPPQIDADDPLPWLDSGEGWSSEMGAHQNGRRKRVWTKAAPVVEGRDLTPFQRAAIGAESTSLIANWGTTGIGFINCDLTLAMSRLPVGDRIGVEAEAHTEDDGISMSTAGLYDAQGRFGVGVVTAVNNAAAEIDFTTVDTTSRYVEG